MIMSNCKNEMPKHVAIIMDGNGRWAEKRGKNSLYQDNSQYLAKKKSRAIGKQQYGKTPLKFNSNPQNDTKNALKRMRSSGSSVPPKFRL